MRGRESIRESLGGASRNKTRQSSLTRSQLQHSQPSQSAEDVLASQLDPDYETRQPAKESRRVSSMLSRAELTTSFDRSAFHDLATHHGGPRESLGSHSRRGQSLGGSIDRLSFGLSASHRRLRASTPGNLSRLSLDDASDTQTIHAGGVSQESTYDDDDVEDALDAYTFDDELDLHHPTDGLRKEFCITKFTEVSMGKPVTLKVPFQQHSPRDEVSRQCSFFTQDSGVRHCGHCKSCCNHSC